MKGGDTLLGSIERANLNHWTTVFSSYLEIKMMENSINPVIPSTLQILLGQKRFTLASFLEVRGSNFGLEPAVLIEGLCGFPKFL
jgi:hypothetical protein